MSKPASNRKNIAARIIRKSAKNSFMYYVKNGHLEWEGILKFSKLLIKWWSLVYVKTVSVSKRKWDIDMEPLCSTNIWRFIDFWCINLQLSGMSSCYPALTRSKRNLLYTDWKHSIKSTWKALWEILLT